MRLLLIASFGIACAGCAVGYRFHGPRPTAAAAATGPDWSALHVAVDAPAFGNARSGAIHVLRARYGVLDATTAATDASFFKLRFASVAHHESSLVWAMPSFITFSLLPGYWSSAKEVRLTVTAPDGATFTTDGVELAERNVTWFPLAFFGANFTDSIGVAGPPDTQLDRVAAEEEVVARLLRAAEPFVAHHGGRP